MQKIYLLCWALLALGSLSFCSFTDKQASISTPQSLAPPLPASIEVSLTFVGDLMCHSPQFKYAKQKDGSYDFRPPFSPVKDFLSESDYTIGNLETVLAGSGVKYGGYPAFNTPDAYADALKDTGFDLLVTANNHSYDQGKKGLLRTLEELEKRDFLTSGTYRSATEAQKLTFFSVKNIRFCLLAYTQFSNIKVPLSEKYLLNHIEMDSVQADITRARAEGAEVVIVHYHWGQEYKQRPNTYQKNITKQTIAAGADIIVADHPHALQPIERFVAAASATLDTGMVAYSLGNFFSNQQWRFSDAGVMLRLIVEKNYDTKNIRLKAIQTVPTWVFKGEIESKRQYRILPSQWVGRDTLPMQYVEGQTWRADYLEETHHEKMKEAFADSKGILTAFDSTVTFVPWRKPHPLPLPQFPAWIPLEFSPLPSPLLPKK